MLSLQAERRKVNGHAMLTTAFSEVQAAMQRQMSEKVNQLLAQDVDHLLARTAYARRAGGLGTNGALPELQDPSL